MLLEQPNLTSTRRFKGLWMFSISNALELARKLYKNERNPLVKGYYLKFGVTIKEMIRNGLINELDNYDEVKNKIYDEMEK